jgi:hypothetical protein
VGKVTGAANPDVKALTLVASLLAGGECVAVIAETGEVVHSRPREGKASSGRGASGFARQALARLKRLGLLDEIVVRATPDGSYRPGVESRRSLVHRAGRPWYQPPTWKWRPSPSLTNQQPSPTPYPLALAAAAGGAFVNASAL